MRAFLLVPAFMLAMGAAAHAAPSSTVTQADIDRMIQSACLKEGGKPEECTCGLKIARDGLTERQFGMFPILWPIVNSKGDTFTKIAAGVAALQAGGYNASDGLGLMATLQANAGRVEQECRKPKGDAPSPPKP